MPTPTYTLVASTVLTSSAASVAFTSLSQSYRDLVVVVNNPSSSINTELRLNDVTNGYNRVTAYVSSGTISSDSSTNVPLSAYSGSEGVIFQIFDYSITDKHKTVLLRANNPTGWISMIVGRWFNTNAVTKIELFGNSNYPAGSSFRIFGIAA